MCLGFFKILNILWSNTSTWGQFEQMASLEQLSLVIRASNKCPELVVLCLAEEIPGVQQQWQQPWGAVLFSKGSSALSGVQCPPWSPRCSPHKDPPIPSHPWCVWRTFPGSVVLSRIPVLEPVPDPCCGDWEGSSSGDVWTPGSCWAPAHRNAASHSDQGLPEKADVVKQLVCDSLSEKPLSLRRWWILSLAWCKQPCFAGKVSFWDINSSPSCFQPPEVITVWAAKTTARVLQPFGSFSILTNIFCLHQFPWQLLSDKSTFHYVDRNRYPAQVDVQFPSAAPMYHSCLGTGIL